MQNPTEEQLTLFAADSPAKTSVWLEDAQGWLEGEAAYSMRLVGSLMNAAQDGSSSKTCPAFYPATEAETCLPSSGAWQNSGMLALTGCWTLSSSEWPSDAAVCSLSDILQDLTPDELQEFSLSPKACAGILRRAEKRGKALPEHLRLALVQVASQDQTGL
jgi:hypothetical protein